MAVYSTSLFAISLLVVIVLYGIINLRRRKKCQKKYKENIVFVQCVEAGCLKEASSEELRKKSYWSKKCFFRDGEGNVIDTRDMIQVITNGICMVPRGISDGDRLLVQRINPEKPLETQIKHDDMLLIYLKDKDITKIRIFDEYNPERELLTYRYTKEGKRHDSSLPHRRESIVGIVRYNIGVVNE